MKRPNIPKIPFSLPVELGSVLTAIKENIELSTGRRGRPITPLESTASTQDMIRKINELIDTLQ